MANPVKLFIVEGESRDYRFVSEMTKCFLRGRYQAKVIKLPAAQNIYMLYQKLAEDDFETDVVEVLRDSVLEAQKILFGIKRQDIDEVYLFFDYDIHQNNLKLNMPEPSKIIENLLITFNNETENGRLYISYPMVEALYDYCVKECLTPSNCFVDLKGIGKYKNISAKDNPNASVRFSINEWRDVINVFYLRIKCLFNLQDLDYRTYKKEILPERICAIEQENVNLNEKVFVLSAFPEFLLDNFKEDFWNSMISLKAKRYKKCPKIMHRKVSN